MNYVLYIFGSQLFCIYIHNDFIPEFNCHKNHGNEIVYNVTFTGIQLPLVYAIIFAVLEKH